MDNVMHIMFLLFVVVCVFNLYKTYYKRYNLSLRSSETIYLKWVDLQLSNRYRKYTAYETNSIFSGIKINTK